MSYNLLLQQATTIGQLIRLLLQKFVTHKGSLFFFL